MTQNQKENLPYQSLEGAEKKTFLPPMHTPGFCQADCHDRVLLAQQRAIAC